MTPLVTALLSGLMFYLSQGRDNVWALAWFAPVPLLWLAYRTARPWKLMLASLAAMLAGSIYLWQCYYGAVPFRILLQVMGPQAVLVDTTATVNAGHVQTPASAIAAARSYASDIQRATNQGARFIVTPEGGMVTTAALRPAMLAPLIAVAQQTGSQIIAGVNQNQPAGNLAFSILPDGTIERYDKRHLVPVMGDRFTPGHRSGWLGDGRAMEICKDMDFPSTIRLDAARGVRLMGVPANDFDKDAWLHARMAVMRGVEDGFALVRAADNGLVTASDAQGRLIASKMDTPTGATMVVADLPLGPGPTLYARIGDVFAWLCAAFLLWVEWLATFRWVAPAGRLRAGFD